MDTRRRLISVAGVLGIAGLLIPHVGKKIDQRSPDLTVVKTLTGIQAAQAQYFSRFGKFADSLQELETAQPSSGGADARYRFTVRRTDKGYCVLADPVTCAAGGPQSFFSDETRLIRQRACLQSGSTADRAGI